MEAMKRSYQLASSCQALLIIGTSAVVSPFNVLPRQAKQVGAMIIEINLERTVLTDHISDILLQGKATEMVSRLVSAVKELKGL
jgi:NAD-dependent deacetylase